jgi:hypothetical protein
MKRGGVGRRDRGILRNHTVVADERKMEETSESKVVTINLTLGGVLKC